MKLCCYVHMYPPIHNAGSEVALHVCMREMAARGHDVTVIADRTPEDYKYEGVSVRALPKDQYHHARVREIASDADILITHLDCTSMAMQLMLDLQKPLVHFVHNHGQLGSWHVPPHKAQLVVFNSHWIAANESYLPFPRFAVASQKPDPIPWPGPSIVIHPVIEPEKYRCERGTKITFCNPTEGKGVETVYALAEAMPDYEFLVVEGIYGEQVAPPNLGEEWEQAHPNIEFMKNDPDFRNVLRKTKVLLMPSNYESYGRCAVEACCAGIPVIVSPTQGLWEALAGDQAYPATETEYGLEGTQCIARETLPEELFEDGLVAGAGIFCLRVTGTPTGADESTKARLEEENAVRLRSWIAQIERLYSDDVYYRSRSDAALKLAASFDPKTDFDRLEDALLITSQDFINKGEGAVKMWTSDRKIWETTDGKLVAEKDGRIPQDAVRLACGIGGQIPEEAAIANGFIAEAKAIEAPEENKAISSPEATKATPRRTRKTKAA